MPPPWSARPLRGGAGTPAAAAGADRRQPPVRHPAGLTSTKLETQIISLPGITAHVKVVSGSCDSSAGQRIAATVAAACLPQTAARRSGSRSATGSRCATPSRAPGPRADHRQSSSRCSRPATTGRLTRWARRRRTCRRPGDGRSAGHELGRARPRSRDQARPRWLDRSRGSPRSAAATWARSAPGWGTGSIAAE